MSEDEHFGKSVWNFAELNGLCWLNLAVCCLACKLLAKGVAIAYGLGA